MNQRILLVSPPFTQLNTPYPATAYLKGFLNMQRVQSSQIDLGMETILRLFSKAGLNELFAVATERLDEASDNSLRIYALRERYISTIDAVIGFLQDDDPTLSHFICQRNFLPEASKFEQMEDLVETALIECEKFYPAFQYVIWGGKTASEAIAAAMIETAG